MSISEYFQGKKILVTGATGFMGKALVEKLLRSCPSISTIYVVIRTKKGDKPKERWSKITELPLFDSLKASQPNALDKVVLIPGESTEDVFGICEDHQEVLKENVNIIYHVAASVSFTEEMVSAIKLNVKSTHSMLELAKHMKNFECFIHISTAYTNIEKIDVEIKEKVYDSPLNWRMILSLVENPEYEGILPAVQPKLMGGHGTTYTLTKRIAESLVEEYSQYFPAVIMRPALIIATAADPFPGWIDTHNALTMFGDAVRKGLIRVVNTDSRRSLQFIPLDLSIRATVIATWHVHVKKMAYGLDVYCVSLGGDDEGYSMTWGDITKNGITLASQYPSNQLLWYPFVFVVRKFALLSVIFFFLQVVPALLSDAYLLLNRSTPRFTRMTIRFFKALVGPLQEFTGRDFKFDRTNYKKLNTLLLPEDENSFSISQSSYDPMELYSLNCEGMVRYILHEDVSCEALNRRKRRLQVFKYLHIASRILMSLVIIYFIGHTNLTALAQGAFPKILQMKQ